MAPQPWLFATLLISAAVFPNLQGPPTGRNTATGPVADPSNVTSLCATCEPFLGCMVTTCNIYVVLTASLPLHPDEVAAGLALLRAQHIGVLLTASVAILSPFALAPGVTPIPILKTRAVQPYFPSRQTPAR